MNLRQASLTSSSRLFRSAVWNFIGMVTPMLAALVVIPLLIDGMGNERFGLLTIVWMGVGYFSLFDLGIGVALTKMVSERLGRSDIADLGALIWTAFSLLAVLGLIGAMLLIILSHSLVTGLLQVPAALSGEAIIAFRAVATGIPIVILTAGLVGILEAHQCFYAIAKIRIPLGVLTFLGPLVTLQFNPSIACATVALLLSRILALVLYYLTAASVRKELRSFQSFDRRQVRSLLSFGGWLTVTNIVGPLMTYLDRFIVGGMLGLSAVAYYSTPYEVLSRLQILPQAIIGVLFPAMSLANSVDKGRLIELYVGGSKVIYWIMLPATAGALLMAPEALSLWLGEDFRDAATPVAQWLAAGWMLNALARPAFTILQASGRPDLVAKTHVAELLPYLGLLWWLAGVYGIVGVAAAWTLRVTADALILNALVAVHVSELRPQIARTCCCVLVTGGVFLVFWIIAPLILRAITLMMVLGMAGLMLWPYVRSALKNLACARRENFNA